jgi:hypothetical protein
MRMVYDYLTGTGFRVHVESIVEEFMEMEKELAKELPKRRQFLMIRRFLDSRQSTKTYDQKRQSSLGAKRLDRIAFHPSSFAASHHSDAYILRPTGSSPSSLSSGVMRARPLEGTPNSCHRHHHDQGAD